MPFRPTEVIEVANAVRAEVADMSGKDVNDELPQRHCHTEFLTWCEVGRPTRLRGRRARMRSTSLSSRRSYSLLREITLGD
jgi:hypothetical protein